MSQSLPPRKPEKKGPDSASPSSEKSDQDHYDLDEMLDSLRDSAREKEEAGEVVTRSDGSVARKVRRRKRRSDQPEGSSKSTKEVKEAKNRKKLILKIALGVVLFSIVAIAAFFTLLRYNSEVYAEKVEKEASEWTGSEVDFVGLKIFPGSIAMKEADFKWPDGYFVKSLELRKVEGDAGLVNLLTDSMGGTEVGSVNGKLVLASPDLGMREINPLPQENFPFDFQLYYCDGLEVVFGESDRLKITNAHTSLRYHTGSGWKLVLDDGLLEFAGWERFPLDGGNLKFDDDELHISALRLAIPERLKEDSPYDSRVVLEGRVPMKPGEVAKLELETTNFPLQGLFGKMLSELFAGSIRSVRDGEVTFTVGKGGVDSIVMPFNAENILVRKFPFTRDLDEIFPDKGFSKADYETNAKGVFHWLPQGTGIENLNMSEKELLKISGNILVSHSGEIQGNLDLYVSWGLIELSPKSKVLKRLEDRKDASGYVKIPVTLGGTVDMPIDNFRSQLGIDQRREPKESGPSLFERATTIDESIFKDNTSEGE